MKVSSCGLDFWTQLCFKPKPTLIKLPSFPPMPLSPGGVDFLRDAQASPVPDSGLSSSSTSSSLSLGSSSSNLQHFSTEESETLESSTDTDEKSSKLVEFLSTRWTRTSPNNSVTLFALSDTYWWSAIITIIWDKPFFFFFCLFEIYEMDFIISKAYTHFFNAMPYL